MGSFPTVQNNEGSIQHKLTPLLTPDSTAFQQNIKKMRFHNSVIQLKRAADETRKQVNKALTSVKKNPFIFRSIKPKNQLISINLANIPQRKQRRVITQIQEKKAIHNSIVMKKEVVKYPEIKQFKQPNNKIDRIVVKRLKVNSALSFITPLK